MAPLLTDKETTDEEGDVRDALDRQRERNKTNLIEERARALEFWVQDDWESIMNMYTNEGYYDPLLCWVRPNRDFLSFLHAELRRLSVTRVVSVGCGCGFLEWLLRRACTGLEIVGYEVDRAWWQGRYGVRPFIDHVYVDETGCYQIPDGSALMTCYFHNWDHWEKYLSEFGGDHLVVIGPHTNGRLSCPQPRHILADHRFHVEKERVLDGGDMIVVARRNCDTWPKPIIQKPKPISQKALVKSAIDPEQQRKQFSEMRRALVLQRIGSAKSHPKPPPVTEQRMGPRLHSVYKTKKPSVTLGVGAISVSSRLQSMGAKNSASKPMPADKTKLNRGSQRKSSSSGSSNIRRSSKKLEGKKETRSSAKPRRKSIKKDNVLFIITHHIYLCHIRCNLQ